MEGGGGRDSVLTLPPEVLKLTHQLEQEKLESLTRRYDVLRKENELLKTRLEKSAAPRPVFFFSFVSGEIIERGAS